MISTLFLIGATICGLIATILGFHWLGTDAANWPGWTAASLTLFYLSILLGGPLPAIFPSRQA